VIDSSRKYFSWPSLDKTTQSCQWRVGKKIAFVLVDNGRHCRLKRSDRMELSIKNGCYKRKTYLIIVHVF
jgi:hypothetical protein